MDFRTNMNDLATRVLDMVERDATQQAADFYEFDSTVYSDPAQFERELEMIFRRLPLFLGLSVEMPNPGDFLTLEIARVPVLLTRGQDGVARAFINACRHRGTPLANGPCGSAGKFVCPYHGWTYRNDGKLIGLAEPEKFGVIDHARLALVALPCEERAGIVFGMLRPELKMDLEGFYGGLLDHLAQYEFQNWTFMSRREITGANWKVAFDGYLETYHFPTAHRDSIGGFVNSGRNAYASYGPHLQMAGGFPTIGELHDVPMEERWTRETRDFSILNLLFPNISLSLGFGGVAQIAQILPGPTVDRNRTVLHHLVRTPPANAQEAAEREKMRDLIVEVLEKEDYGLGERVQVGVNSATPFRIMFGRNEPANQHFHRWVQYCLEGDETAPMPVL